MRPERVSSTILPITGVMSLAVAGWGGNEGSDAVMLEEPSVSKGLPGSDPPSL